jgi:ElaB/YqjD/DUF883 family membrane-anchored ribosome-binding protein
MTVTTDVSTDKTGDTATVQGRFTLKNLPTFDVAEARKPFFAYVGVADLAIEQAKELPNVVKTLPSQVKELRDEVETRVAKAGEQANDFYAKLAVRGERLVTSIRRQPATQAAVAEGKEAVRKAEAAAVAAKKSAKAGEKAVEGAGDKIG